MCQSDRVRNATFSYEIAAECVAPEKRSLKEKRASCGRRKKGTCLEMKERIPSQGDHY